MKPQRVVARNHTEILSNVVSSQVEEHKQYGGVVPEIASRRHCEFISATVKKALLDAGKTMEDVDAVAVTFAPGLIGAVLVGVNFAKGLAYSAISLWCRCTTCADTLPHCTSPTRS